MMVCFLWQGLQDDYRTYYDIAIFDITEKPKYDDAYLRFRDK